MSKTSRPRAKNNTRAKTAPKSTSAKNKTSVKSVAAAPIEIPKPETVQTSSSLQPRLEHFYKWNIWLAVIFVAQAAAILLLSTTHDVTVTTNYVAPDPLLSATGQTVLVAAVHRLFEVNIAFLIALFLLLAGIAHVVSASVYRKRYEAELSRGINRVRWIEYACTAALILGIVALLGGVYDISSLLMIMALTASMYMVGLFVDLRTRGKPLSEWASSRLACLAGLLPGFVLLFYAFATQLYGATHLPSFVYWLYGSMAIIFIALATNFYLQHKARGKWANYLYGERVFMIISVVAKTAMAWQIFAGLLHP